MTEPPDFSTAAMAAREAPATSRAAIAAVEKSGGSVKTTYKKTVHMNKKGQPGKRLQRRTAAAEKRGKAKAG